VVRQVLGRAVVATSYIGEDQAEPVKF